MSAEQAKEVFGRMRDFMRQGPQDGVNNFTLEGPIDVPTNMIHFIGLFPTWGGGPELIAISTTGANALKIYPIVSGMKLPQRVRDMKIKGDVELRRLSEIVSNLNGWPSILIAIGQTRETQEQVVVMFSVVGMKPEDAFKEIQERVKSRLDSMN